MARSLSVPTFRSPVLRDVMIALASFGLILWAVLPAKAQQPLLNVSYDPTREFYKELNDAFAAEQKAKGGLAAWAWGLEQHKGDEAKVREFVGQIFRNVPVLDIGARASTTTFAQRGLGDVLIAWENEAFLALEEFGADKFDIVIPSISVLAEPPVALVDGNVDVKGTRAVAEAYLQY